MIHALRGGLTGKVSARKMGPGQDRRRRAWSPLWRECWRLALLPVMHNSCQILFLSTFTLLYNHLYDSPFGRLWLLHKFLTNCKNFRHAPHAEPEESRCIRGPGNAQYCCDRTWRTGGENSAESANPASRRDQRDPITGICSPWLGCGDRICSAERSPRGSAKRGSGSGGDVRPREELLGRLQPAAGSYLPSEETAPPFAVYSHRRLSRIPSCKATGAPAEICSALP
jgi:hypothetical protein